MTRSTTPQQLEFDLQAARDHGRWLSDEELLRMEQDQRNQIEAQEKQLNLRRRLIILTGVCILLPPLWPLAFGLTLYLLFPRTIARVGVVAGVFLVAAAIVSFGLITALALWLISVLL